MSSFGPYRGGLGRPWGCRCRCLGGEFRLPYDKVRDVHGQSVCARYRPTTGGLRLGGDRMRSQPIRQGTLWGISYEVWPARVATFGDESTGPEPVKRQYVGYGVRDAVTRIRGGGHAGEGRPMSIQREGQTSKQRANKRRMARPKNGLAVIGTPKRRRRKSGELRGGILRRAAQCGGGNGHRYGRAMTATLARIAGAIYRRAVSTTPATR
jgi:hypothetical protein